LDINQDRGEFLGFPNPIGNYFPSPEGYGSFLAPTSMQPYQGGKLVATLGLGWLKDNMATPVTTMVRASGGGPPNVGKGSSKPSNNGQPKGPSHSTESRKQMS
jgi:hypothetical protein